MKKALIIIGFIAAFFLLVATIFKTLHYPGAGVMLIFGTFLLTIVYSPLLLIQQNRDAKKGLQKATNFFQFFCVLNLFFAFLYKVQHYAGADLMLYSSYLVLLVFLVIYIINTAKEPESIKKINMLNLAIIFIAMASIFWMMMAIRVSKNVLESYSVINKRIEQTIKNQKEINTDVYDNLYKMSREDSINKKPIFNKALYANKYADDLIKYIQNLKSKLIAFTEEIPINEAESIGTDHIQGKDITDIPTRCLIGESPDGSAGEARMLKNKIGDFKKNMLELVTEDDKIINLGLDVSDVSDEDGNKVTWEISVFNKTTLIADIVILNQLISEVKSAEYTVITHLTYVPVKMKTCKDDKEKKCCKKDEKKNAQEK